MNFISVVIPAFNEENRLASTLDALLAYAGKSSWPIIELIVVDDGSSDETAALVREYASRNEIVRLVQNAGNRGKGYSVRQGMLAASGDWILFTDADLSTPIEDLACLLDAITRCNVPIVFGSRALDRSLVSKHQGLFREICGRFFNLVVRALTGMPYRDTQCGFKMYQREAARKIFAMQRLDGFGFDVEDLYLAKKLGIPALEIPVHWKNVAGTKVSLLAGLRSFVDVVKIRWYDVSGSYSIEHSADAARSR